MRRMAARHTSAGVTQIEVRDLLRSVVDEISIFRAFAGGPEKEKVA
jgi:hypothetical protein